jgi:hypothetical protein
MKPEICLMGHHYSFCHVVERYSSAAYRFRPIRCKGLLGAHRYDPHDTG